MARDTNSLSTDLRSSTNIGQSLQRLAHYLRALLRTMAGEDPDDPRFQNMDPDYDGAGFTTEDLKELETLLDELDVKSGSYAGLEGRQDWALERESEISRLERENEELRRMLGIDEPSMAEKGITLDLDRIESGRTLLSRRQQTQAESYQRAAYWDNSPGQQAGHLQRPLDLQPGMRAGPQARRPGMFGPPQPQPQRPFMGAGRGVSAALGGPPSPWQNQPPSPAPPVVERSWQPPTGSGLDIGR